MSKPLVGRGREDRPRAVQPRRGEDGEARPNPLSSLPVMMATPPAGVPWSGDNKETLFQPGPGALTGELGTRGAAGDSPEASARCSGPTGFGIGQIVA